MMKKSGTYPTVVVDSDWNANYTNMLMANSQTINSKQYYISQINWVWKMILQSGLAQNRSR